MGRYLDLIADLTPQAQESLRSYEKNEIISPPGINSFISYCRPAPDTRFRAVWRVLEGRCPDYVDIDHWQRAVADGRHFLSRWGEQAGRLGWTARDLFGLHILTVEPGPSYRRLSRYDATGLIWLLQGREVVALTSETAAIRWPGGSVTTYRKDNKPALGPLGDSMDDLK